MTRVINLATEQEIIFSLPPKAAVVAAYEQARGNWNTWTYDPFVRHPKSSEGLYTVSCGDWTAIKQQPLKDGHEYMIWPDIDFLSGQQCWRLSRADGRLVAGGQAYRDLDAAYEVSEAFENVRLVIPTPVAKVLKQDNIVWSYMSQRYERIIGER